MTEERTPVHSEGWKQWSSQVKESLDKLEGKVDLLENRITKHREEFLIEITTLKVKAGVMGMVAGIVTSTLMSLVAGIILYNITVANHKRGDIEQKRPITLGQTTSKTDSVIRYSGNVLYVEEDES